VLVVTPYYNKGTDSGIVKHYLQIAEASTAPVLLYNVPGRTGVNLSFGVLDKLADHPNIVGIKEASDSHDRLVSLRTYGENLDLYAGNDSAIYTSLAIGGAGVISVLSNAYPREVSDICELYFSGRFQESLERQVRALPLIRALFTETNPTPIKYVMERLGYCSAEVRLPLDRASSATMEQIDRAIGHFKNK
jgi:4-hydroxy-tetrahydrodipicolinate synthase